MFSTSVFWTSDHSIHMIFSSLLACSSKKNDFPNKQILSKPKNSRSWKNVFYLQENWCYCTWDICKPQMRLAVPSNKFRLLTSDLPSPTAGLPHHLPVWWLLHVYFITISAPTLLTMILEGSIAAKQSGCRHLVNKDKRLSRYTIAFLALIWDCNGSKLGSSYKQ